MGLIIVLRLILHQLAEHFRIFAVVAVNNQVIVRLFRIIHLVQKNRSIHVVLTVYVMSNIKVIVSLDNRIVDACVGDPDPADQIRYFLFQCLVFFQNRISRFLCRKHLIPVQCFQRTSGPHRTGFSVCRNVLRFCLFGRSGILGLFGNHHNNHDNQQNTACHRGDCFCNFFFYIHPYQRPLNLHVPITRQGIMGT